MAVVSRACFIQKQFQCPMTTVGMAWRRMATNSRDGRRGAKSVMNHVINLRRGHHACSQTVYWLNRENFISQEKCRETRRREGEDRSARNTSRLDRDSRRHGALNSPCSGHERRNEPRGKASRGKGRPSSSYERRQRHQPQSAHGAERFSSSTDNIKVSGVTEVTTARGTRLAVHNLVDVSATA